MIFGHSFFYPDDFVVGFVFFDPDGRITILLDKYHHKKSIIWQDVLLLQFLFEESCADFNVNGWSTNPP